MCSCINWPKYLQYLSGSCWINDINNNPKRFYKATGGYWDLHHIILFEPYEPYEYATQTKNTFISQILFNIMKKKKKTLFFNVE